MEDSRNTLDERCRTQQLLNASIQTGLSSMAFADEIGDHFADPRQNQRGKLLYVNETRWGDRAEIALRKFEYDIPT